MEGRLAVLQQTLDNAAKFKDPFYTKLMGEVMTVTDRQCDTFQQQKGNYRIDGSLSDLISFQAPINTNESSKVCK